MKLAVLGGGGVRSPFLAKYISNKSDKLKIDSVVFMDNDAEKLRIYGGISKKAANVINQKLKFEITTDAKEALKDADFIITSLRVGQDESRVTDERTALKYGVVGQETTGAGGFAMALRSITALLKYCSMVREYSKPHALIFNFTNPSGLVTQALRSQGYDNVYGICDGPRGFLKELASCLNVDIDDISVECFGLNHLSWFRSIKIKGEEKIDDLIKYEKIYKETEISMFEPELIKSIGLIPNAYLYYYYYREKAMENITKSQNTRGEVIREINQRMHQELKFLDPEKDFEKMLCIFLKYYSMRERSYMTIESGSDKPHIEKEITWEDFFNFEGGEGYAGIALNYIDALVNGVNKEMILSVPNKGMIEGLRDDDVVEITCNVDKNGAHPIYIGSVPDIEMSLIKQVKLYERLAVEAIIEKDIDRAVKALMVHPLVNSYSIAKKLAYEYLNAYKDYVGLWR